MRRLIDLSTLKPNPNKGRRDYLFPGKCVGDGGTMQHVTLARITSLSPEGSWLFRYEDPEVTCVHCEAVFPVSTLIDGPDMDDLGENDPALFHGCPQCGEWDCLGDDEYVELETVEDALKRTPAATGPIKKEEN